MRSHYLRKVKATWIMLYISIVTFTYAQKPVLNNAYSYCEVTVGTILYNLDYVREPGT